jgi:DNA-binding NarL/FixJ family response regulator
MIIQIEHHDFTSLPALINFLNQGKYEFMLKESAHAPLEKDHKSTKPENQIIKEFNRQKKLGRKGLLVLEQLSQGKSYEEISSILEISIDGVRYYVKKVFKALGVSNGRDAVRIYLTEIKPKIHFE